ncbi:MAG TPA: transporter [Gemmatimonadales bacterium]|jgi:hypothetical protein|nr:transporter [Gemmatimonadales bacterium]
MRAWKAIAAVLALAPSLVGAQSLEPRLYLPLPTGLSAVVVSYTHLQGAVVVDAALPITDFRATLNMGAVGFAHAFGLSGRSAQLQVVAPFASGTARAVVAGQDTTRELRGPADPQLRLGVNVLGAPARRRSELAGVRFGTMVGVSLAVTLPLGHYDTDRRLNIGANRWALKPEVALVEPLGGGWALEGYGGIWLFGRNSAYLDTATVTQDPLWSLQGHLIRLFARRAWVALDAALVSGGATSVDDVPQSNFQRNSRVGATAAWFLGHGHSLKAAFATGVYTRFGGDFTVFSLGYQYGWGG